MEDKELELYFQKLEPHFESHLEKGTIEMSNEYYNMMEERFARKQNKNVELEEKIRKLEIENNLMRELLSRPINYTYGIR